MYLSRTRKILNWNLPKLLKKSQWNKYVYVFRRLMPTITLSTSLYLYHNYYQQYRQTKCDSGIKFNSAANFTVIIYDYKSDQPVASGIIIDENGLCISVASTFPNISDERIDLDPFYVKILGQDTTFKIELHTYIPDQNLVLFKLVKTDPDIKFIPAKFTTGSDIGSEAFVISKSQQHFNVVERGIINETNYNVRTGFGKENDTSSFNIMINIPNNQPSIYGGPLINQTGNVLGLIIPFDQNLLKSHIFVMPSDYLQGIIDQAKQYKAVQRPFLGMSIKSAASGNGVYVLKVNTDGPAHKAGVKIGDTILEVNDKKISNNNDFFKCIGFRSGEKLKLKVENNGRTRILFIDPEKMRKYTD